MFVVDADADDANGFESFPIGGALLCAHPAAGAVVAVGVPEKDDFAFDDVAFAPQVEVVGAFVNALEF